MISSNTLHTGDYSVMHAAATRGISIMLPRFMNTNCSPPHWSSGIIMAMPRSSG